MHIRLLPALAFAGLVMTAPLASCSTTQSMAGYGSDRSSPQMFPISYEEADRILATAMASVFAGQPISRVEFPNRGYQATLRFAFDTHTIVGYVVSAEGLAQDGTKKDGYYFEVSGSGTMPISGGSKVQAVYDRAVQDASRIAAPLPQTR
jgi:hypothetical protein